MKGKCIPAPVPSEKRRENRRDRDSSPDHPNEPRKEVPYNAATKKVRESSSSSSFIHSKNTYNRMREEFGSGRMVTHVGCLLFNHQNTFLVKSPNLRT